MNGEAAWLRKIEHTLSSAIAVSKSISRDKVDKCDGNVSTRDGIQDNVATYL